MKDLTLIGVASGWGARDRRCEDGPDRLLATMPLSCLASEGHAPPSYEILRAAPPSTERDVTAAVVEINQRLASAVRRCVSADYFPIVIGGDHSCAVGTWSGVYGAVAERGTLGLLWVDAHMDSHVPQTSPSGALHGMPLACLLGHGLNELTHLAGPAAKLNPAHVCLLGVRSFEAGEAALLAALGVRVILMDEVAWRGFATVWREAVARVSGASAGYGITLDLDALDPRDAPGVGTPSPEGIGADELVRALAATRYDQNCLALEIAEYNPHLDHDQMTLRLLRRILCAVSAGADE
ncbi:MAG: arginase [Pseudomonadota bacterium]